MSKSENNPDTYRTSDEQKEVRYDVPVQSGPNRYTDANVDLERQALLIRAEKELREKAHIRARENAVSPTRWDSARAREIESMGRVAMVEKIEVLEFRLVEERARYLLDNKRLEDEVNRLRAALEGLRRNWHDEEDDEDDEDQRGPCPDALGYCWCGTANWNAGIDTILNPMRTLAAWREHHQHIAARSTLQKIDQELADLHKALLELGPNEGQDSEAAREDRQETLQGIQEHEIWLTNLLNKHGWLLAELQGQEDPF